MRVQIPQRSPRPLRLIGEDAGKNRKTVLCLWPGSSNGRAPDCLSGGCGFKSRPGRQMPPSSRWTGYPLPKRRARVQIPQGAPQKTVRNFFAGKSEASCGRVQTTKENREDIINMQTEQIKLSSCFPLHYTMQVTWPGSSSGRSPDCRSGECGFESRPGRHMLPSSNRQDI